MRPRRRSPSDSWNSWHSPVLLRMSEFACKRTCRFTWAAAGVSGATEMPVASNPGETRSGRSSCLDVLFEVVQNRLPAAALLLDGVRSLRVESLPHRDAICTRKELDQQAPVAKGALDQ